MRNRAKSLLRGVFFIKVWNLFRGILKPMDTHVYTYIYLSGPPPPRGVSLSEQGTFCSLSPIFFSRPDLLTIMISSEIENVILHINQPVIYLNILK